MGAQKKTAYKALAPATSHPPVWTPPAISRREWVEPTGAPCVARLATGPVPGCRGRSACQRARRRGGAAGKVAVAAPTAPTGGMTHAGASRSRVTTVWGAAQPRRRLGGVRADAVPIVGRADAHLGGCALGCTAAPGAPPPSQAGAYRGPWRARCRLPPWGAPQTHRVRGTQSKGRALGGAPPCRGGGGGATAACRGCAAVAGARRGAIHQTRARWTHGGGSCRRVARRRGA